MQRRFLHMSLLIMMVAALFVTACSGNQPAQQNQQAGGETAGQQAAPSQGGDHPLKGKSIEMSILGIGGWLPSKLGVDMSPEFAKYAKEKYGYDVTFTFEEAPFSSLFQKAAASLATQSQEYNIIISDSQWLGAFAEPGWIVKLNDVIDKNPELKNIKWADPVVQKGYMNYPDGSSDIWGLPQEADIIVLYVRKDMLEDPKEQAAFKAKYGYNLPKTFEDFEKISMDEYEQIAEFFTRPDKGLYGTALQYSKEYDFMSCFLLPYIWSTGGEVWDSKTNQVEGILNTENNAKALERMVGLMKSAPPGSLNYGIPQVIESFSQGKIFSAFQWAAVGDAMITPELRDKVMVVPPPGFKNDGKIERVYTLGGQPWVINKFNDEEHMTVAIDFIKWWYMPETQLEFAKRGGNPAVKDVLESPGFEDIHPWYKAYKYMLKEANARDFWHDPKYAEMLAAQQAAFTAYASGTAKDPLNALTYAACQQQKILHDAGRVSTAPTGACANVELK